MSAIRTHGKTTFIDIREEHHRVQIAIGKELYENNKTGSGDGNGSVKENDNQNASSSSFTTDIRRGDIIGVDG